MSDDYDFSDDDRCDLLSELGHLAWLVKYSLRETTADTAYGFIDGLVQSVMESIDCDDEHMVHAAAAIQRAFKSSHRYIGNAESILKAKEVAR